MGGSGGTSIATNAMRALPVGVPKLMVSTVGGGDVSAYAGTKDITFMPSIVDVAGFNRISRAIYTNAAGAIAGMVSMSAPEAATDKPLIAASMFGNTTQSETAPPRTRPSHNRRSLIRPAPAKGKGEFGGRSSRAVQAA
jgi:uncharacterized protein (UPF0261 family)